jgi:hypothetical protein
MFGRLKALESQYEGSMGRPKDFRFLSPESRKILKGLGADVESIDGVAGGKQASVAPSAPPPGSVPVPGKVSKAGKAVYRLANGKFWEQD